jgi:NAD(P)-dependent dehydrogenase (short-subunit alcohol dehydrogenase family)
LEDVKGKLPSGKGLWAIMNNAGILGPTGPPDWQTIEDYKAIAAVNVYGLVDVTLTFLPLVRMERGRVVNTSSIVGRMSFPTSIPYCVSKYGVEAFTDGFRRAMRAFGVTAHMIEPGVHNTSFMSKEAIAGNIRKAYDKLSPDIKKEYGDEYLKFMTTTSLDAFIKIGSYDFDKVVDAYQHALLGLFPRARYMVGADAKFIFLPIQWMPEWMGDWVFSKLTSKSRVRPAGAIN